MEQISQVLDRYTRELQERDELPQSSAPQQHSQSSD